ncbi:MAG: redoxin domain-containing protein [Planctomycetota bacterium]|nr:redoxin domain-containing protein [Planctomycetota bacterium]
MLLRYRLAVLALSWLATCGTAVAQTPTPEFALQYRPAQKDVEYDSPAAADVSKCKVELERNGDTSGFAVFDANGLILRRYVDTNKDRYIDQWRYYQNSIEVYRDLDTDFNHKTDQSRWLNTGGSRWGIDSDEDGKIDEWKYLSAEEASRVAISAMIDGDAALLSTVLVTAKDLKSLGLIDELASKLLRQVQEPEAAMRTILGSSRTVSSKSKWNRFDAAMPGVIPKDDGKANVDLIVYEGAMAIVETAGQHGFVQLGEMMRFGDVWKLTSIPRPAEGDSIQIQIGGVLMQPATPVGATTSQELSPALQGLIAQLQKIDQQAPAQNAKPQQLIEYLRQRTAIIEQIVSASRPGEESETWTKQLINSLTSAMQAGDQPSRTRLSQVLSGLQQKSPKSDLIAYAQYRQLFAVYSSDIGQAASNEQQQKIQAAWLNDLKQFIDAHPNAEDAPDAILQLALNAEFAGNVQESRSWYGKLVSNHGKSPQAVRAAGALLRMDLKGKPLTLSGPDLSGRQVNVSNLNDRVVLVVFWATWSTQFVADVPVLRALYEQYGDRGFEVVGVNLDQQVSDVTTFTKQNRITWPNIFQPGGLDAPLAQQFGLVTVPTMFLVDRDGRVISNGLTINDLKEKLATTFRKQ